MKTVDQVVAGKFATAASALMTRIFSADYNPNSRRLAIACGRASIGAAIKSSGHPTFDVLGLGFRPGKEWKGPAEIFVEEMQNGELRTWSDVHLWAASDDTPLYLLTNDPGVFFSYDGNALVRLGGEINDREEGVRRALARLREAARRVPANIEQHRMM